jgi:hypothetical protein
VIATGIDAPQPAAWGMGVDDRHSVGGDLGVLKAHVAQVQEDVQDVEPGSRGTGMSP